MKGDEGGTPPRWKQGGKGGESSGDPSPFPKGSPGKGNPERERGSIPGGPDKEMGKDRSKPRESRGWGKGRGEREGQRGTDGERGLTGREGLRGRPGLRGTDRERGFERERGVERDREKVIEGQREGRVSDGLMVDADTSSMDGCECTYQETLDRLEQLVNEPNTRSEEKGEEHRDVDGEYDTTTSKGTERERDDEQNCTYQDGSCAVKALDGMIRGFVTAYALREGVGGITRAIQGWRRRKNGEVLQTYQTSPLPSRDALYAGFFVGGFTGTYHAIKCFLTRRGVQGEKASFAAGTLAGTSILFLDQDKRRILALYLMARVAQSGYNSLKAKGKWHFWGNKWKYGDTLLFSVASAQVMYAYVIRPETLPPSYLAFIERISPIPKHVIGSVRDCCRNRPVDMETLKNHCRKHGRDLLLANNRPGTIPCAIMHPKHESCFVHNQAVFVKAFRSTFPLYLSLSTVPVLVFNTNAFMQKPLRSVGRSLLSAVQSTTFLSAFVSIYMGAVCLHRKLELPDHKLNYFVGGLLSGCALLVEKKSRRSELALYVMPRAIDALFLSMVDRKYLPSIPHGEVVLFSLCMGSLMYYYDHEQGTVAPFAHALIRRIVYGQDPLLKVPSVAKLLPSEGSSDDDKDKPNETLE